jgi:hypothetical protein
MAIAVISVRERFLPARANLNRVKKDATGLLPSRPNL